MKIDPYYFSRGKRVFDLVVALLLLVLLSPLLVMIGAVVLLTAGAPLVFKQKRLGRGGLAFLTFKFRTMTRNATMLKPKYDHLNEAPAPMFKIARDPRFVGIGWLLSRTGLDELPQLWNVVRGEMSLVGPRPLPVGEARALPKDWRAWREQVRPGIFSQWALSGDKHQSLATWRKLEEATLQTGNPKEDLRQMFLTVKVIFLSLIKR
jgi:lipopolysaccharide/colanic/teichoic acid biosynthesis glycosyltransferase